MASDYFVFDNSFYSDPFSPFVDSTSIDSSHHDVLLQSFQDCINGNIQESSTLGVVSNSLDQIPCGLTTPHDFHNAINSSDFSGLGVVKSEEFQISFGSENGNFNNSFCVDNAMRLMQRSYSSNLVDEKQPNFCFRPSFDCVLDSSNLQPQASYQIRRASSTGDLQRMKTVETRNIISSGPLSAERSSLEGPNFKVGRYSAEERKERIHRYRAKRSLRNFNKTIKYACRKTLADNRPRIRGRFARNEEAIEIPKAGIFNGYEEEEDLWLAFQDEDGFVITDIKAALEVRSMWMRILHRLTGTSGFPKGKSVTDLEENTNLMDP